MPKSIQVPVNANTVRNKQMKDEVNYRRELQEYMIIANAWVCCMSCENWMDNRCGQYNAVPPPNIIICGCSEWDSKISF